MLTGLPVIATKVGGMEDIVSEREARLIPFGDSGLLAKSVIDCFTEPVETKARVLAAKERAQFLYDPERNRDELLAVWKEISRIR